MCDFNCSGGAVDHAKTELGFLLEDLTKPHTITNTMYTLRENIDGGALTNNDIRTALLGGATTASEFKEVLHQSKALAKKK